MATGDLVTLAEAKKHLNINDTSSDDELAGFITSASRMWVERGGPGADSPQYDEWHTGGGMRVALNRGHVLAISEITEASGTAITTLTEQNAGGSGSDGYSLNKRSGVLKRRSGGMASAFAPGIENVHVVYTAGFVTAPADIKQAANILISHLWETQRGGSKRPGSDDEGYAAKGSTYSWPRRVEEIFQSYVEPGIA